MKDSLFHSLELSVFTYFTISKLMDVKLGKVNKYKMSY